MNSWMSAESPLPAIPTLSKFSVEWRLASDWSFQTLIDSSGGVSVNEHCVIDRHMVSGRTFHDTCHYAGPMIKTLDTACRQ